jgi:hypothetical protein
VIVGDNVLIAIPDVDRGRGQDDPSNFPNAILKKKKQPGVRAISQFFRN